LKKKNVIHLKKKQNKNVLRKLIQIKKRQIFINIKKSNENKKKLSKSKKSKQGRKKLDRFFKQRIKQNV
jgi:hypothetical protein